MPTSLPPLFQLKFASFLPFFVLSILLLFYAIAPETEWDPEILYMIANEPVAPPSSPSQEVINILLGPVRDRIRNKLEAEKRGEQREMDLLWNQLGLSPTAGYDGGPPVISPVGRGGRPQRQAIFKPDTLEIDVNGHVRGNGQFRAGMRKDVIQEAAERKGEMERIAREQGPRRDPPPPRRAPLPPPPPPPLHIVLDDDLDEEDE